MHYDTCVTCRSIYADYRTLSFTSKLTLISFTKTIADATLFLKNIFCHILLIIINYK